MSDWLKMTVAYPVTLTSPLTAILYSLLLAFPLWVISPADALDFGPGSPGFLSTCSTTEAVANLLLQSQSFSAPPWAGAGATAPTVTANAAIAPDNSMTASAVAFPAVSGEGNRSVLYQRTNSVADWPYMADIYVKGAAGGETLWIGATENGRANSFSETRITATTSWQRVALPWKNKAAHQIFEIGVDLRDRAQTAQGAQTVYVWGGQLLFDSYREWSYIPTTDAAVTRTQTQDCPAAIAFRDFSKLTAYSGNPITPQNTMSYNAGGTSNPYMAPWAKIGDTYYAFANCTVSGGNRGTWPNQCLYGGTDPTHWTDYAAGNPALKGSAREWDDHYLLHGVIAPACRLANWCYYYSAMDISGNSAIGIATSPDLVAWSKYSGSPLDLSAYGTSHPSLPTMIQIGNTLYMYTAVSNNYSTWIAIWTSPAIDGINWRYGGAAITQPIAGEWTYPRFPYLLDPHVFKNQHGFYEMAYTAFAGNYTPEQRVGYAISADGVNWYNYDAAPILTQASPAYPGYTNVGDAVFFEDGKTFSLLFNYDDGYTQSQGEVAQMTDY